MMKPKTTVYCICYLDWRIINFVRTVRRSHSTEHTIFQLARNTLCLAVNSSFSQKLLNDNGNNEGRRQRWRQRYTIKTLRRKTMRKNHRIRWQYKTENVFLLSCERIQSVTSTLLRIEWNGMEMDGAESVLVQQSQLQHFIAILLSPGKSGSVAHVSKLFRRIFPVVHTNASVIGMYLHLDYRSRQKLLLAFKCALHVYMAHSMRLASQFNIFMYLYRLLQLSMNSLDQMKFSCGDKLCVVHPHVINDLHCCTKSFERHFPTNKKKHAQLRLMLSSLSSCLDIC